jgi:hypothetical protein
LAGCKVDAQASPQFNQLREHWKKSGYPSIDTDLADAFRAISQNIDANHCTKMQRFSAILRDFVLLKYRQKNSAAREGARGGWRIIGLYRKQSGTLYPIIVYPKKEWDDATQEIVEASVQQMLGALQMELIITCQNAACHKSFKVASPGKRSDYAGVPDVEMDAVCPYCETGHRITWPKDVKFITAQNV